MNPVVYTRQNLHQGHLREDPSVESVGEGRLQEQLVVSNLQRFGDHGWAAVRYAEVFITDIEHVPKPSSKKVLPIAFHRPGERLVDIEFCGYPDSMARELPRY